MRLKTLLPVIILLLTQQLNFAQLRLPAIIGSNMVLQRGKPVPIWGWAEPGTVVTVTFGGQQKKAKADTDSSWKVVFSSFRESGIPRNMTISGGNTITLTNLLVGEVWLCSGQSNMEYPMKIGTGYAKPARGADSAAFEITKSYPNIRIFKVEKVLSTPDVTSSGWNECSGKAMEQFSAAGFYFAKNVQQALNIPIGVIASSWGGSRIEPWTPVEGYTALPAFAAESGGTPVMIESVIPGKNYKSMILPLAPFALRGFLWYQGESNCMINDGMRYADKMQALVQSWRKQWGSDRLSFYSVQIAPYYYTKRKDRQLHTTETAPEFWEAQTQSQNIPRTATTVITDLVDNLSDIHPSYKWEVGRRLALLALANDYNIDVVSSGPFFERLNIKGSKAVLSFKNSAGLHSKDGGPLSWFTIAGDDGKFETAMADIQGEKVIVSAPSVIEPTKVRFAWHETARPNLFNGAGLPAVPFRTDGLKWKYKK